MKQPFHKKNKNKNNTDSSEDEPWIPVIHRPGSPHPSSLSASSPFTTIMFNPPLNQSAGQSSEYPTPAPITYGIAPGCPRHQDWISQFISVRRPDCHTVAWFPFRWEIGCSFYTDSGALHRSMCGEMQKELSSVMMASTSFSKYHSRYCCRLMALSSFINWAA